MEKKIDFSEIQTLASILNKLHIKKDISISVSAIYEHFTADEVDDIKVLIQESYTVKDIAEIYGTDCVKVKRVIRLINRGKV